MRQSIVLLSLLVLVMAGGAYAADQPGAGAGTPAVAPAANASDVGADQQEAAADAQDEAATEAEEAGEEGRKRRDIALMLGVYDPINSQVKDIFGSSWLRLGLRQLPTELGTRWRPGYDVNYYGMQRTNLLVPGGKEKVRLIPITVGLLRAFGKDEKVRSYVALNAGPYYGRVLAPSIGVNTTGWRLNANAAVGWIFRERFCIEGRYEFMDELAGLDFSAFSVSVALRIYSKQR